MRALYDLVIVGGGAAGLTAALYASRSGLDYIVLDPSSPEGSSIALTDAVENYTGFSDIAGFDLLRNKQIFEIVRFSFSDFYGILYPILLIFPDE